MAGDPKFEASQDFPISPTRRTRSRSASLGLRVDRPEDIGPAWERPCARTGPVLVEAVRRPRRPPLPPHITLKEAKAYAAR